MHIKYRIIIGFICFFAYCQTSISQQSKTLSWELKSPQNSVDWIVSKDKGLEQRLATVFQKISIEKPEQALPTLSLLQEQNNSEALVASAIEHFSSAIYSSKITKKMYADIKTLTPYSLREQLITALIPRLFETNESNESSIKQLRLLVESLKVSDQRTQLEHGITYNTMLENRQLAIKYAESLQAPSKDYSIDAIVKYWAKDELEKCDQWLETVDGTIDLAKSSMALLSIDDSDLGLADKWLDRIENDEKRVNASFDVIDKWYNTEEKAGLYYLTFHKHISSQQKLQVLATWYPDNVFLTAEHAIKWIETGALNTSL